MAVVPTEMRAQGKVLLVNAVAALLLACPSLVLAGGSAELQSISYLRTSPDRFTSGAAFALQYERDAVLGASKLIEARTSVTLNGFASDARSLTPEAPEFYLKTSDRFSSLHSITLGRRIQGWSRMDEAWSMGAWAPRFSWNPLKPAQVGLFGLSYEYRSKIFSLRAFGSPVFLPERGVPLRVENGKLVSPNPDAAIPFESVSLLNQSVPIRYSLVMPGIRELVLHPSAITQIRVGEEQNGPWSSLTAGVKPINSVDVSASAGLVLQPTQFIDATLNPRVVNHRIATLEAGWKARSFEAWGSLTRELPMPDALPSGRSSSQLGAATLSSLGMGWRPVRPLQFEAGWLSVNEQASSSESSDGDVEIALPSRFRFKHSARAALHWEAHERLRYSTAFVRDFEGQGSWLSAEAQYLLPRSRWRLGVGADLFSVDQSSTGLLGPYQGNDRFQGRLTYVF